jgi:hypothetical protein
MTDYIVECKCGKRSRIFKEYETVFCTICNTYMQPLINNQAPSSSLSSVGLDGLLSLANELEIEGKFLDNPHDSEADRASGQTYKECAERIRDFIEKTEAD